MWLAIGVPTGEVRGFNPRPHSNLQNFFNCVFAKYIVRAVLIYSLNPKFCTGKKLKLYANLTFCFRFWGTKSPRLPYRGYFPLGSTGDFCLPGPLARPPTYRTRSIVKSWVRLRWSQFLWNMNHSDHTQSTEMIDKRAPHTQKLHKFVKARKRYTLSQLHHMPTRHSRNYHLYSVLHACFFLIVF